MGLWKDWWQDDLPCLFSREQTQSNYDFLCSLIGEEWLQRAIGNPGAENHPLLQQWTVVGGFFEMNVLAEDLKILSHVRGLDTLLRDLRDADRCLPTWHVMHSAALFMRAQGQTVTEFFTHNDATSPDFRATTPSRSFLVEGKLLLESVQEEQFKRYAEPICTTIVDDIMPTEGHHPLVFVLVKSPSDYPSPERIFESTLDAMKNRDPLPRLTKGVGFNILLENLPAPPVNMNSSKGCFIISPRSEKENFRFHDRTRKASSQVLSFADGAECGILCLGLGAHEDATHVSTSIGRRFAEGQYSGLSSVMLSRRRDYVGPPQRTYIDAIAVVDNSHATKRRPGDLRVQCVGVLAPLSVGDRSQSSVSIYKYGKVTGRGSRDSSLPVPKLDTMERILFE